MNKSTSIVGMVLAFLAGMMVMWGIGQATGGGT